MLKQAKPIQLMLVVLLLTMYVALGTQKINLHTADLGRHLKNGEIFIKEYKIPKTNYYSYTHPDEPFLNHHWGSGVIFYMVQAIAGFPGLSIFNTSLNVIALFLFFYIAWKYSSFEIAVLTSVLGIIILSTRTEIRPESLSHLFMALFFFLLWEYKNGLNFKYLFALPLLSLIWVNTHVFFFLGLFLLGVFGIGAIVAQDFKKLKELLFIAILCTLATLINPAGVEGALYPLNIFNNYGYRVLENQSVIFIDKIFNFVPALYFKFAFILLCLSWVLVFLKDRKRFLTFYPELFILTVVMSFIAWTAVRNFSIFAFFAVVVTAINLKNIKSIKNYQSFYPQILTLVGFILFILFILNGTFWSAKFTLSGIGVSENVFGASEFFKKNDLKGPIFNNYDNGGYLIYNLFPQEKVFTDNRPEAYPINFFNKTYIPMQEDNTKWKEMSDKYNFNSIFFYRHDATPWAQSFLIERVNDPEWAPVYVDEYSIIFLKRNEQNALNIKTFELDKRIFNVTAN